MSLISIILLAYNPDSEIINRVIKTVLDQSYKNFEFILMDDGSKNKDYLKNIKAKKVKIIENDPNIGISGSLNKAIKLSKGEIIVTVLQDTIPTSKDWLKSLLKPFEDKKVVAATSLVEYVPECFEKCSDIIKPLIKPSLGKHIHGLDEKGSAYRKDALEKVGLFDDKNFRIGGEDFDMDKKMRSIGKAIDSSATVIHWHIFDKDAFLKMHSGYGLTFGVLARLNKFRVKGIRGATFRALFPLWTLKKFLDMGSLGWKIRAFPFLIRCNWKYSFNFWKSFFKIR